MGVSSLQFHLKNSCSNEPTNVQEAFNSVTRETDTEHLPEKVKELFQGMQRDDIFYAVQMTEPLKNQSKWN